MVTYRGTGRFCRSSVTVPYEEMPEFRSRSGVRVVMVASRIGSPAACSPAQTVPALVERWFPELDRTTPVLMKAGSRIFIDDPWSSFFVEREPGRRRGGVLNWAPFRLGCCLCPVLE
jgi:hypothetical protein